MHGNNVQMKKLFSIFFTLSLLVAMTGFTSCKGGDGDDSDGEGGGKPSKAKVEKVIDKYDNGDDLTDADYNVLLSYAEAALKEITKPRKDYLRANETDDVELERKAKQQMEKIADKYDLMEYVGNILEDTQYNMSSKIEKRYEKFMDKVHALD